MIALCFFQSRLITFLETTSVSFALLIIFFFLVTLEEKVPKR